MISKLLRNQMIGNWYYTYDFGANENLSHKQSVLNYGTHYVIHRL